MTPMALLALVAAVVACCPRGDAGSGRDGRSVNDDPRDR